MCEIGTTERGQISRLVEYINKSAPLLKDNPLALGFGNKFQELLDLVSNCPKNWIYFKPYEDIGGIFKPIDYYGVDEIVPYLFDKVELNRWHIVKLEYCPSALRAAGSGIEFNLDLVRVHISNNPKTWQLALMKDCMWIEGGIRHDYKH